MTIDQLLAIRSAAGGESPRWRPDGQLITFVSSLGGAADLWGIDPDGGFPFKLTTDLGPMPFMAARSPQWSPDGMAVAYLSARGESTELWLWRPGGGPDQQLTHLGAHINAFAWAPDGQSLVLSGNRYGAYHIYRVEVASGQTFHLTAGPLNEVYPVFSPDGNHVVYVRLDESWTEHEVVVINLDGSAPRVVCRDTEMFDYFYGKAFGAPLITPDSQWLLFRSHRSGWLNYYRVPFDGSGEAVPVAPATADQSDGALSPDGQLLAYVQNQNGTLDLRVVAVQGGEPRILTAPAMGVCSAPQWSPEGGRITYLLQRPTCPADLFVVDVTTGASVRLTASTAPLDELIEPEKVTYEGHEGLPISAYLYRPKVIRAGERLPGILYVHGGPASQWLDTFELYAQFFAQQGYVLLLPNIRGSTGYGKPFLEANRQDWCGKDLQDVVSGRAFLRELPYVDPDQIGIMGTSYGGILSMCAVTFLPGLFQAAIPMAGYCDWVYTYHEQELRHIKYLEHALGPFAANEEIYRRCSAIRLVSQATTPCLILHGEGRAPRTKNSLLFAKELERHYKTFRYKTYPGEGYYVQSPRNVRAMLLDMQEWFDLYLKG